jgi:hypothetical protein
MTGNLFTLQSHLIVSITYFDRNTYARNEMTLVRTGDGK